MLVYLALFAQVLAGAAAGTAEPLDQKTLLNLFHGSILNREVQEAVAQTEVVQKESRNLRDAVKIDDIRLDYFADDQCMMMVESRQTHGQYCSPSSNDMKTKSGCTMDGNLVKRLMLNYGTQPDCKGNPVATQIVDARDDNGQPIIAGQCMQFEGRSAMAYCDRKDRLKDAPGVHYLQYHPGDPTCKPKSKRLHSRGGLHGTLKFHQCVPSGPVSLMYLGCNGDNGIDMAVYMNSPNCQGEFMQQTMDIPPPCTAPEGYDNPPTQTVMCIPEGP